MSQEDLLQRSVASVHRVAMDDVHWLAAASAVNEVVGARGHGLAFGPRIFAARWRAPLLAHVL